MVLKKVIIIFVFILTVFSLLAEEVPATDLYWTKLIQTSFSNNPNFFEIQAQYNSVLINKLQYDYSFIPYLSFGTQATVTGTSGSLVTMINQTQADTSRNYILSPYTSVSLNQKLPANGALSLNLNYGFNYVFEKNVYLQYPEMTLNLSQPLIKGAFGILKNPERELIYEQLYYYKLQYEKAITNELLTLFNLIQNIDLIFSEEDYSKALTSQYESELKTAEAKKARGLQSDLETFYSEHEYITNLSKLKEIQKQKSSLLNELLILFPDFEYTDLEQQRQTLKKEINELYYTIFEGKESMINSDDENYLIYRMVRNNTDSEMYSSILYQNYLQYLNNETSYAPVFFISSSFGVNQNLNVYYSDFSKSFRVLTEPPCPINYSISIGFSKTFEFPKAKQLRKEIYDLNESTIRNELNNSLNKQKQEILLLFEQIENETDYIQKLEKELPKENEFREKRKKLFEQNLITKDEYLQSETKYFLIQKEYLSTFWNIINNQIKVINLCCNNALLINHFLGDFYENTLQNKNQNL